MKRFIISLIFVSTAAFALFYAGDAPERRYSEDSCQYNMIYGSASDPIGLVTVGGSRVLVSTRARDFNSVLQGIKPDALSVHNMAHSYYSIEKEYVLLRDLLERRSAKAALIMIEPRIFSYGKANADYIKIAKLSDIPMAVRTMWPESRVEALRTVRDIIWEHTAILKQTNGGLRSIEAPNDCDTGDLRLDVPGLLVATQSFQTALGGQLAWDLSAPTDAGFTRWMDAYRSLSQKHGVEFFFILMTNMLEPLPSGTMEEAFRKATGMHLITLTPDLQRQLSPDGRRDASHINKVGRDIFLPWLIKRIDEKCTRPDGCF